MLKRVGKTGLAALAFLAASGVAHISSAQSIPLDGKPDAEWRYSLTGYAFVPFSTQGTSTVAGSTVDLDLGLSDVLDLLDFALAARGEAWKGDWGFIGDFNYVSLGLDSEIGLPGQVGGSVGVDVDVTQKWVSLLATYRFADGVYGDADRRFAWDVSFGARWNSLEQKIVADVSVDIGPGPGVQTTLGGTETWWEPMVGLRATYQIADRWALGARAEFGGFGVGGDNLQYTLLAEASWQAWEHTSLKFGYQYYSIDFETDRSDGTFAYDVAQHGPYLGITYQY